jgi:hypothetical protein
MASAHLWGSKMRKISLQDIRPLSEYEGLRKKIRADIIEIKKARRIQVGKMISFVFENRDTVIFQIQEMMRAEHIYDKSRIQDEIDIFNQLIPDEGELSATLFIEITEQSRIKEELDRLQGLDRNQVVFFELGHHSTIPALFETGRSTEDKISSVHYLRFRFSKEQQDLLSQLETQVNLVIKHPNYKEMATLSPETRKSLLTDFK